MTIVRRRELRARATSPATCGFPLRPWSARSGASDSRGIGWEYVHVAIDDCTRVPYAETLIAETGSLVRLFVPAGTYDLVISNQLAPDGNIASPTYPVVIASNQDSALGSRRMCRAVAGGDRKAITP